MEKSVAAIMVIIGVCLKQFTQIILLKSRIE